MNDNYLWDKTGEPDEEVQELEELLGTLRHKPQPLELPRTVLVGKRRTFIPLAIAAAIAMLVIAAGIWLRAINSTRLPVPVQQANLNPESAPQREATPVTPQNIVVTYDPPPPGQRHRRSNGLRLARYTPQPAAPELSAAEEAEKEQVLIALRLVSAKLNLAQRKTQGLPQVNAIRNQHKIG